MPACQEVCAALVIGCTSSMVGRRIPIMSARAAMCCVLAVMLLVTPALGCICSSCSLSHETVIAGHSHIPRTLESEAHQYHQDGCCPESSCQNMSGGCAEPRAQAQAVGDKIGRSNLAMLIGTIVRDQLAAVRLTKSFQTTAIVPAHAPPTLLRV